MKFGLRSPVRRMVYLALKKIYASDSRVFTSQPMANHAGAAALMLSFVWPVFPVVSESCTDLGSLFARFLTVRS